MTGLRRQKVRKELLVLVVAVNLPLSSCATRALWNATNPNHLVRISQNDVTVAELERSGRTYIAEETSHTYRVEKTRLRKSGDYSARILGTPLLVVVDVLTFYTVLFLPNAVLEKIGEGCGQIDYLDSEE